MEPTSSCLSWFASSQLKVNICNTYFASNLNPWNGEYIQIEKNNTNDVVCREGILSEQINVFPTIHLEAAAEGKVIFGILNIPRIP